MLLDSIPLFADSQTRNFHAGLSQYQVEGVEFLLRARRAILADHLGLGKSAQAISAACMAVAGEVLVVTKKSLITNWLTEIEKWSFDRSVNWEVTNYEQVVLHPERFSGRYDVLIVDEAAALRNRKSQRSKAIRKLARRIPYVWFLTGTPVVNGPWDLWPLLNAIDHKKYSSFWKFVQHHVLTADNGWGTEFVGVRDERALAKELAPYMLRRTREILNLPPLTFEDVYVPLSDEQRTLYERLRRDFIVEVRKAADATPKTLLVASAGALLVRLRQVCCSPALVGGKDESGKTDALLDILEELTPAHKVLVFSFFAEYVRLLLPKLAAYNPVSITGDMNKSKRDQAVDKFLNDKSCRVLVGTIGAMGEGLNLQAADVVIFTDQDWTPAMNEQAWGRAYRRGQNKPVHVIRLIAKGTVEEHVQRKIDEKASLAQVVEHAIAVLKTDEKVRVERQE